MIQKYSRLFRMGVGMLVLIIPVAAVSVFLLSTHAAGLVQAQPARDEVQRVPLQTGLPTVRFAASLFQADEDDGIATINVQISRSPTETVTVNYSTAEGTATAGSDFVSTSGVLTFTAGTSTLIQSFDITLINNSLTEPDETVLLILQNPVNAVVGTPGIAELEIEDDDDPTATPTSTGAAPTPIFADIYESNDTIQNATTLEPNSTVFCDTPNATLWPADDVDFYRFWAKAGSWYVVRTDNLDLGIDTIMALYNTNGELIETNDDFGSRASRIMFDPPVDGYYYVQITNKDASDPADKTYCVDIDEILPTVEPTDTPRPTSTRVPGADRCEINNSFDNACTIGLDQTETFNFVPLEGTDTDNDFFRLWMKAGELYTCETTNLSAVNDTNIIIYDQNENGLAGNDDKAPGDRGSLVSYRATYTGWLFILVGPHAIPEYADSAQYTYDLTCTVDASTPTPTAPPTVAFTGGGTGGVSAPPTSTPEPSPDIDATIQAAVEAVATEPPTPPPAVQIVPLPTNTPVAAGGAASELTVLLYYDANQDFTPQMDEGIMDVAVSVYDGVTGQLLNFGYTNQVGMLRFGILETTNVVRVSVPFFGFDQTVVVGTPEIRLRVAPRPLPGAIP